ncbi:oligopeptide ABC transporter, periplasmic oligopeptide-binding protein OppA [Geomicrobium sp. JCM 19038]|nr:oligopeptide ABC transporter, periplasmic oligopeptide-binding protein OppA [Geomicrobium sp. JCM 19038]
MMTKRNALVLGLSSALLLTACSSDPEESETSSNANETSSEVEAGGNFILAMPSDPVTLNPHAATDIPSTIVFTNIYENLVMNDENMELQPALSESYDQIDDLTWEFNLREDVSFHDGEPFNADAVVTNFERFLDPDTASPRASLFELVEDIEAVDEYTVHFKTSAPFAPLPAHLAHGSAGIVSPKAIEQDEAGESDLTMNPVGTGPFEFDSWEQGNELVLSANESYYGEVPAIDQATFKVVPEQSTRIAMMEQGEAHYMQQIEPANVGQFDHMDDVSVITQEQLGYEYIGFNTEVEPFDDPLVRQALTMTVNRETLLEGLYDGYGLVAESPLTENTFGYSSNIEPLEYNPEKAKELLAEAGYEDGFEATILTNDANPLRVQVAELVQDYFQEVGVTLSIELMEWGAYLDAVGEGNSDMFVLGWSSATGDADYALHPNYHSDNLGSAGNQTFYQNEEVDEWLIQAREETDEDARLALYEQIEQQIVDDAPAIFTVHNDYIVGLSDHVDGFIHLPNGVLQLKNVSLSESDSGY